MRIGRHIPTGSQPIRALEIARSIGCEAIQIFVTNPRGWREPEAHPEAELAFRAATKRLEIGPVVVHATYLINLASPRDDFFAQSVSLLRATLARAARFGAASVVLHIGSHMGAGDDAGIARLADGLRRSLEGAPTSVALLLENDVGAGGELGYRFENIAAALAAVPEFTDQLGVCLDSAHLWGAGFDLSTPDGVEHTLSAFDKVVGLRRVQVFHLNDTKVALGSHRDVHARIGEGIIGRAGMEHLLRHRELAHATVLLETPILDVTPGKPDWRFEAEQLQRVYGLAARQFPAEIVTTGGAPADVVAADSAPEVGEAAPPRHATKRPSRAKEPVSGTTSRRARTRIPS